MVNVVQGLDLSSMIKVYRLIIGQGFNLWFGLKQFIKVFLCKLSLNT